MQTTSASQSRRPRPDLTTMQPSPSSAPVVLITGASRGIGAATARAFGLAGWRVAITARTEIEGQALDHQLRRPDGTLLAGSLATTAEAMRATGATVFAQPMDLMPRPHWTPPSTPCSPTTARSIC